MTDEWSTDRGSATIEVRTPAVVWITASGHLDSNMGKNVISTIDKHLRERPRHLFFELEELNDYAPGVRQAFTKMIVEHRSRVRSLHVLARSRIVRMGASVVALTFPSLVVHGDRGKFLAALNAALADRSTG